MPSTAALSVEDYEMPNVEVIHVCQFIGICVYIYICKWMKTDGRSAIVLTLGVGYISQLCLFVYRIYCSITFLSSENKTCFFWDIGAGVFGLCLLGTHRVFGR